MFDRITTAARDFFLMNRLFGAFRRDASAGEFPLGLQLQTHTRCNGRCRICPYPHTAAGRPHGHMSEQLFTRIAGQAATEPLLSTVVFMLQNEPLLDKRLFSWIRRLKEMNRRKKAVVVTNGERLDDFSSAEIAASGVDELIISLNAHTRQTFTLLHPGLDYDRIQRNIETLRQHAHLRRRLRISFIQTAPAQAEFAAAVGYWRRRGVPVLGGGLVNRAGALETYSDFKPQQRNRTPSWRLRRKLHRWYLRHGLGLNVCLTPLIAMYILYNGDVILCCSDWRHAPVVGNLNRQSLREVWNSDALRQCRQALHAGDYAAIPACRNCSVAADIVTRHDF